MVVKNDLYDYQNRYIFQDTNFFKFSIDSVLLAEYAKNVKKTDVIVDLCAGNMAVGLIMSTYIQNKITGFEIQKSIYKLGIDSINYNKMESQLNIINDDVKNIGTYFKKGSIDVITCNPPFFKVSDLKITNDIPELSIARHEIKITLEDIFSLAKTYLKDNGKLYLIYRIERLDEIINFGVKYNLCVKNIVFIKTKEDNKFSSILIKCVKNSKMGIKIEKEICLDKLTTYQHLFEV